jgi:hypothetical protein
MTSICKKDEKNDLKPKGTLKILKYDNKNQLRG